MRKLLLLIPLIIAGCVAQPTCIKIPGEECKKINAGNVGGTTLGYSNEIQDLPAKASIAQDKP